MEEAMRAVREDGASVREASERFGVKRSTLHDRLKGRSDVIGRPPVIPKQLEDLVEAYACKMADVGFGLSKGKSHNLTISIWRQGPLVAARYKIQNFHYVNRATFTPTQIIIDLFQTLFSPWPSH